MILIRVVITRAFSVFFPDGVNTFIFELGAAMVRKGVDVHIISGCGRGVRDNELSYLFDVEQIPKIHCLKKQLFSSRAEEILYWTIYGTRILRKLQPDITIMNGAVPCWSPGTKFVVCHGLRTRGSYPIAHKLYDYIIYRSTGSLVAVSQPLKREIENELKLTDVVVIPTGLDTRRFSGLPLDKRERAILHVGVRPVKNLQTTLKAFEIVSREMPEAKLYVLGNEAISYQSFVENRIKGRVRFLGTMPKSELRGLYSKVRALSSPSVYEAFPYTTLEAFASATPIVGSRAIPKELLIDGYNGYVIESPVDHETLAGRLIRLLTNDSEWENMSSKASATVLRYDISKIADMYMNQKRTANPHD